MHSAVSLETGEELESEEYLLELIEVLDPGCFDSFGVKEFAVFLIFLAA